MITFAGMATATMMSDAMMRSRRESWSGNILHTYVSNPRPGTSRYCFGRSAQSLRERVRSADSKRGTRFVGEGLAGAAGRWPGERGRPRGDPCAPGEPAAGLAGKPVAIEHEADLQAAVEAAAPVQPERERRSRRDASTRERHHWHGVAMDFVGRVETTVGWNVRRLKMKRR